MLCSNRTKRALKWIVGILNERRVPFLITGGFAAALYGSSRRTNDIDIEIRKTEFQKVLPRVKEFIVFGPGQYIDRNFDVHMVTLNFHGQEIDIGAGCRIYDHEATRWRLITQDLGERRKKKFFGMTLPIIPRQNLISIKKAIARRNDVRDVKELTRSGPGQNA